MRVGRRPRRRGVGRLTPSMSHVPIRHPLAAFSARAISRASRSAPTAIRRRRAHHERVPGLAEPVGSRRRRTGWPRRSAPGRMPTVVRRPPSRPARASMTPPSPPHTTTARVRARGRRLGDGESPAGLAGPARRCTSGPRRRPARADGSRRRASVGRRGRRPAPRGSTAIAIRRGQHGAATISAEPARPSQRPVPSSARRRRHRRRVVHDLGEHDDQREDAPRARARFRAERRAQQAERDGEPGRS